MTGGPPEFGVTEDGAETGLEGEALMLKNQGVVHYREDAAAVKAPTFEGERTASKTTTACRSS